MSLCARVKYKLLVYFRYILLNSIFKSVYGLYLYLIINIFISNNISRINQINKTPDIYIINFNTMQLLLHDLVKSLILKLLRAILYLCACKIMFVKIKF